MFFILLTAGCSSSVDSLYNSAIKDLQNRKFDSAEKKFEKIVSYQVLSHEKLANLYKAAGVNYVNSRMFDLAIENLNKAKDYRPNDWEVYFYLGVAHSNKSRLDSSQLKESEENFLNSLKLNDMASDAYYGLGMLYYAGYSNPSKAVEIFNELLTKDANYIRAYKALAKIHYEQGRLSEAVELYKQAALILPPGAEKSSLYVQTAKIYIEWKNFDLARNYLRNALSSNTRNSEAKKLFDEIS